MSFLEGEIAILNEKANTGLPNRVGESCMILDGEFYSSPNYEYRVEFLDGGTAPVKESELNKLTDDDKIFMEYIYTGNKVLHIATNEIVKVLKVDYLHQQVEIEHNDSSVQVVCFEAVKMIEERDSVKELKVGNSEQYKMLLQEKYDVYVRKNKDYGNSFEEQFNEYGILSAIIRLDDKLRRLKQLRENKANVKDESIRDTALDLANYADMLVMVLDKGIHNV